MARSLITGLPHKLFEEQIVERLPLSACVALAATCTWAKSWFPNEGTGEMLVEEGASDWSEDEF